MLQKQLDRNAKEGKKNYRSKNELMGEDLRLNLQQSFLSASSQPPSDFSGEQSCKWETGGVGAPMVWEEAYL
jgi:hypothetical protein